MTTTTEGTTQESWVRELNFLARKGSELIVSKGWVQDSMYGEKGELCIISAGHKAAEVTRTTPGLSHVLREVLDHLGHAEHWNDRKDQQQREVVSYLNQVMITPEIMVQTFGPRWEQVCELAALLSSWEYKNVSDWMDSRNEEYDYESLKQFDSEGPIDPREQHARNAVCAAASKRAFDLGLRPLGPAVGLLTARLIRPTLTS